MSATTRIVSASPHIKAGDTTPTIMWSVVMGLGPVVASAIYFFGPSAMFVVAASTLGAIAPESLLGRQGTRSLRDGSAAITGILLGLTLPPGIPLWMAFLGGAFGIGFGKLIFGGLGQNVFNPALLGRAFLQAAFPVALTTWPVPADGWSSLRGDNFAFPLMGPEDVDGFSGATPLGLIKFEQTSTPDWDLILGTTSGSLGETSGIVILLCGLYLAARKHLNWRIPASILAVVALFSALLHGFDAARYPGPVFMLFSGGLMLGAVFMATDMVTSPVTRRGCWIFGAGIGFLVVVIRIWGGLAEGVMYAILLMNALVPFINRATQPNVFATHPLRRKP